MNRSTYLAGTVFCVFLIGCDQATLIRKFTPPEDESAARGYVDLLRKKKFEQVEHALDPSIVDSNTQDTLTKMSAMFPADTPRSTKVVGVNLFHGPQGSESNISLEYEFPSKWLLVNVDIRRLGAVVTIAGFHVDEMSDSLESTNKFTLKGRGPGRYSMLVMAILLPIFSLYVLVLCIRTKNLKKKWLWILFILVGVGKLAVNWTTAEWHVTPLAFNIPCATAFAPAYGPWTLAVYLPLGAILFLRKRKKQLEEQSVLLVSSGPGNPTPD